MLRAISLRSLKSEGRSEISKSITSSDYDLQNLDFDNFIQSSCKKYLCPIPITVTRQVLREAQPLKVAKKSKRKSFIQPVEEATLKHVLDFGQEEKNLVLTAIYGGLNQLLELLMVKYTYQVIPRVLMQLIGLKVPFSQHLTKFTIRQCCIDMFTIYELNKILTLSNITDICLDHCPLKEANYDILLSDTSSLRSLSLSRCFINDIVCERIAARLHNSEPAEPTLLTLNLSSNLITDVGAKHIGEALRHNRHLRYLNIADNHIGDTGAKYIFEVLREFPLTVDERQDKTRCYIKYWKKMELLYNNYMMNMNTHAICKKSAKKGTLGKVKPTMKRDKITHHIPKDGSNEYLSMKARSLVLEILGPFEHRFNPSMIKEEKLYCIGNFTLCYLNLRYNNLTYQSVQSLAAVVQHQLMYRNENLWGLVTVLLEGNYLPEKCNEYIMLKNNLIKPRKKQIK